MPSQWGTIPLTRIELTAASVRKRNGTIVTVFCLIKLQKDLWVYPDSNRDYTSRLHFVRVGCLSNYTIDPGCDCRTLTGDLRPYVYGGNSFSELSR